MPGHPPTSLQASRTRQKETQCIVYSLNLDGTWLHPGNLWRPLFPEIEIKCAWVINAVNVDTELTLIRFLVAACARSQA
jgi:hypothetical protein